MMIIYNVYTVGVPISPFKADSPLVVDADAMLTFPLPCQFFQAIGRRNAKVLEREGPVQHTQLSQGDMLNILRKFMGTLARKNLLRFIGFERPNH
jgi:hypothetical protein